MDAKVVDTNDFIGGESEINKLSRGPGDQRNTPPDKLFFGFLRTHDSARYKPIAGVKPQLPTVETPTWLLL